MLKNNISKVIEYDIQASLQINRKCNFRCPYCFFTNSWESEQPDIDFDKIVDFFSKSNKTWYIQLGGGEPFVYPKFIELCKELTKKHYISFNTNLSSQLVYKFIKEINPDKVGHIVCSVQITELEKFNLKEEFIKKIKLLREKGFSANATMVLWPPLLNRTKEIFDYFAKEDIYIRPNGFRGTYNNQEYPESYTSEESQKMKYYLEQFLKNQRKSNLILKPRSLDIIKKTTTHQLEGSLSFHGILCHAGSRHVLIDSKGYVRRCHSDKTILGNIFESNLKLLKTPTKCNSLKCTCFFEGLNYALGNPKLITKNINAIEIKNKDLRDRLKILKKMVPKN